MRPSRLCRSRFPRAAFLCPRCAEVRGNPALWGCSDSIQTLIPQPAAAAAPEDGAGRRQRGAPRAVREPCGVRAWRVWER